jgi:hypothetical protein
MINEDLTVEICGKQYTGRRVVSGSRTMYQTIYYRGRSKDDGHPYRPGEETNMKLIAETILGELVQEQI